MPRQARLLQLPGFYEFGAQNRVEGWNAMVTVAIPLGGGGQAK